MARPRKTLQPAFPANSKSKVKAAIGARKKSRAKLFIPLSIAAGVLLPLGILVGFLDGYGMKQIPQHADAIVVLGAQVQPGGKASHDLQMRVLHALRLYKKGLSPRIITTGGVGDNPPAEAEVEAKILMGKGVPRQNIFLENKSTSTWENTKFAARICRAHGWKKVIVVSDPFHLWRAHRNFARNGVLSSGAPVAREEWQSQPLRKIFWTTREAILVVRDWCLRRV